MARNGWQRGKVQYWALILSVAAHSATLAVFTGVKMSGAVSKEQPVQRPVMNVQMIQQAVAEPTPKPKPRVEPIVTPACPPQPESTPLISEPQPEPVVADVTPEQTAPEVEQTTIEPPAVNEVEFFGQKSIVQRICYVVDCSGSMYGRMYQVKDQLKQSILNLNSQQAFSIVFFMQGRTLRATSGTLTPATLQTKSKAIELIDSIRPCGSTDAAHALEWAMGLKDESHNPAELIYFLSDGFDLDSDSSAQFVSQLQSLRQSLVPNAVMHTIGFGSQPQDCQTLQQLAQNTGGEFIAVN